MNQEQTGQRYLFPYLRSRIAEAGRQAIAAGEPVPEGADDPDSLWVWGAAFKIWLEQWNYRRN